MLTQRLQNTIEKFIRRSFASLRMNLLGPDSVPKSLIFSLRDFSPQTTLVSNYLAAHSINSLDPKSVDDQTVNKIKNVASNYIDAIEQKSVADVMRIIGEKYDNLALQAKREDKSIREVVLSEAGQKVLSALEEELDKQKAKTNKAVDLLVNHELHNAQNAGALDGIVGAAKSMGIDDPTVFKIGVLDDDRCPYCWRLWTLKDKVTPKVYKLSELSGSPGNYKNPEPSVNPTHPNCRDVLTFLMPGFGLEGSRIVYVGNQHDEFKKQRG